MKKVPALFLGVFLVLLGSLELYRRTQFIPGPAMPKPEKIAIGYDLSPLTSPSPTPAPTPSPEELEAKYGPCAFVPILMYHHVNYGELATAGGYTSLNVTPDTFRSQLEYLQNNAYQVIPLTALNDFFDLGIALAPKPAILTFDDGYADFVEVAAPILQEFGFPATLFVTTGLMENPGYTTWNALAGLNPSLFILGNHTWSHHNMQSSIKTIEFELGTADTQLADHNFNKDRIFAYPYGITSTSAKEWLKSHDYSLAVTTINNSYHCRGLRYNLGRVRIGNSSLYVYGL